MRGRVLAGLVAASLISACSTVPVSDKVYHGPGFGMRLPTTVTLCTNKPPAPDHGFVALLRSEDCRRSDRLPRIEAILSDMPREIGDEPTSVVANICFTGKAKPAGFSAGDRPVAVCIDDKPLGGLDYRQYFLFRRKPATHEGKWSMLIIYVFSAHETVAADDQAARDAIAHIDWQ